MKRLSTFAWVLASGALLCSCGALSPTPEAPLVDEGRLLRESIAPFEGCDAVAFENFDGATLMTKPAHSKVVYDGETPVRPSNEKYDYSFRQWAATHEEGSSLTRVKALYERKLRQYEVEFRLPDGTLLSKQTLDYGAMPSLDKDIPNAEEFVGFDRPLSPVKGNAVYHLSYRNPSSPTYFSYGLVFEHFLNAEGKDEFAVMSYLGDDKAVEIPDTFQGEPVTKVLFGAFAGNENITSIRFGANVEIIDPGAIYDNPSLVKFIVDEENPYLFLIDEALYQHESADSYSLVAYPAKAAADTYKLPRYISRHEPEGGKTFDYYIYGGAFRKTSLEIMKFDETCPISSFDSLFNGYWDEKTEFPASLRTVFVEGGDVDDNFFNGIPTIESIILERNDAAPMRRIGHSAFKGCSGLTKIVLPDTVTDIEPYAFANCVNLRSIELGFRQLNVQSIGSNAFDGCPNLKGYDVGGVEYLGNRYHPCQIAFKVDKEAESLSFGEETIAIYDGAAEGAGARRISFQGNNLTHIGPRAFASLTELTEISLPFSVTEIARDAFENMPQSFCDTKSFADANIPSNGNGFPVVEDFYIYRSSRPDISANARFMDLYALYPLTVARTFTLDSGNESFQLYNNGLYGLKDDVLHAAKNGTGSFEIHSPSGRYVTGVGSAAMYRTNYSGLSFRYANVTDVAYRAFGRMANLANTSYSIFDLNDAVNIGVEAFWNSGASGKTLYFSLDGEAVRSIGEKAFASIANANVKLNYIETLDDNPLIAFNRNEWVTANVILQYA